ncbi:MAG: BNR/Asp-box repeat protein, partial [Paenibacillus sp.]|nr:BNR/Asp-box repeat protein [Paenibacillus sp.]
GAGAMNKIRLVHRDHLSCEPILRRCPNGELVCVGQIGDVKEPAPGNRVVVFHSKDNGETWSKPFSIYPEDGQAVYATEVMLLDDVLYAFLTLHNGYFGNWQITTMKSSDSGYTWENIGPFPELPNYSFARGMIRARNGDILIPYQHYPVTPEENARIVRELVKITQCYVPYVESGLLISKDNGRSYSREQGVRIPLKGEGQPSWSWTEPTIAELSDGRLVMLLRVNESGCLWRAESTDGGITWSEAQRTDIPNPSNKPKLLAMPGGRIALIHTPNEKQGLLHRTPLEIWISDDDMETWGYKRMISDFPGGFCYPDGIVEEDGRVIRFTIEFCRFNTLYIEHEVEQ